MHIVFRIHVLLVLMIAAGHAGAAIIKGPWLQDLSQTGVRVRWETDAGSDSRIDYGLTVFYGSYIAGDYSTYLPESGTYLHEIAVSGLSADTPYHYRVTTSGYSSDDNVFRTAVPAGTPFRFAVYGDSLNDPANPDPSRHEAVANGILAFNPLFVIHVGDLVNDDYVYSQWEDQYFTPARNLLYSTPLFVSAGNHEGTSHWVTDYIYFPNDDRWWSFDIGDAHFIILDSEVPYEPGSEQYLWLENDLGATTMDWIFVFLHKPPYSTGNHGGEYYATVMRAFLVPLFENYGVDIVFSGHDHFYERSFKDGVSYVVTGGGGAPFYSPNYYPHPYQIYAEINLEFCTIDVSGTETIVRARYSDGSVFDSLTISSMSGDSDGDGMEDNWEQAFFGDLSRDGAGDYDGDGLSDGDEYIHNVNPRLDDTDNDGLYDGDEVSWGINPRLPDSDGDGMSDYDEVGLDGNYAQYNPYPGGGDSDAALSDTDNDGYTDYMEITSASNLLNASSIPAFLRVNFQPADSDTPSKFIRTDTSSYSDGRCYGWR